MSLSDPFRDVPVARDHPAQDMFAITPHDVNALPQMTRFIRCGGTAGNVSVLTRPGNTRLIQNIQVGEIIPLEVSQVFAASTTATGLEGYY